MNRLRIVECPRDAMQGILHPISTGLKIQYLNHLLRVGFDTLDFGSFVSPKAVPQMADTEAVLNGLELAGVSTRLLAIVVNQRGAEKACTFPAIDYLGYPFSLSETFQLRNSRKTMAESLDLVKSMQQLCHRYEKQLVVYLSMAFGNPYGDPWTVELVEEWAEKMAVLAVPIIALADTVGTADAECIRHLFGTLIPRFPEVEFGAHFHARAEARKLKLAAAWQAGCRRFDTALQGYGGCPFAKDELVGNIATESLIAYCEEQQIPLDLNQEALAAANLLVPSVFQ